MRIVIDMQGAQTASRFRGIGRYTTALARGILRNAGEHEIWLVVSDGLYQSIDAIRADFAGLLPQDRIRVFTALAPVPDTHPCFDARREAAEVIREHFIAQLHPDAVLVTSLFESYFEHAVVSAGRFADPARTAVILYDLIPLFNPDTYLSSSLARTLYMDKIASLKRAGLLLAISDYARAEAIGALALNPDHVVAISTAVDETFLPRQLAPKELAAIGQQFGITRAMLMYAPGGYDTRKNLNGMISAYSLLPAALRASHQLVVASRLTEANRADLTAHARRCGLRDDELVLTGYVSDAHLIGLYQSAALFIFPSLHEGFGLPALEAMACGAPVIGSNTTSLPEVIGLAEAMFDPASPPAIAAKIAEVLGDPAMLARLRTHGRMQAARFSWNATARRALSAMEAQVAIAPPRPAAPDQAALVAALARIPGLAQDEDVLLELALCIAAMPDLAQAPRQYADATSAGQQHAPHAQQLVLSFSSGVWHYRDGRGTLGTVASLQTGDTVTGVNLTSQEVMQATAVGMYAHLHRLGVRLHLRADDTVLAPARPWVPEWYALLACADVVVCTSDAVAQALRSDLAGQAHAPAVEVAVAVAQDAVQAAIHAPG